MLAASDLIVYSYSAVSACALRSACGNVMLRPEVAPLSCVLLPLAARYVRTHIATTRAFCEEERGIKKFSYGLCQALSRSSQPIGRDAE